MPAVSGQQRREMTVLQTGLVHPHLTLTLTLEYFRINFFQAGGADTECAFEQVLLERIRRFPDDLCW